MANKIAKLVPDETYNFSSITRMNIDEFRELGLLRELNRRFLHPRGLALEVVLDDDPAVPTRFGGVWDYRADPEGMFAPDVDEGIIRKVDDMAKAKLEVRKATGLCDDDGIQVNDYIHKKEGQ